MRDAIPPTAPRAAVQENSSEETLRKGVLASVAAIPTLSEQKSPRASSSSRLFKLHQVVLIICLAEPFVNTRMKIRGGILPGMFIRYIMPSPTPCGGEPAMMQEVPL
ncbi:hypothetical protein [Cohnella sp. REN36]|uniref:hypothetical protein n=1 Tax=Cohnella sp. REN36 TaxID=2887347 RepID=UPI001D15C460|nr:hypothetical protein [Cohnella sp. REN36]